MYNDELKRRFINQYTKSDAMASNCVYLFNHFEKYELEWGADLCTQSTEKLQTAIDNLFGLRKQSSWARITILREYVKWCISEDIAGVCDGMLHIKDVGLNKVRMLSVASPAHLQQYLDKLFAPIEDKTTDCIYRCYLWLAYCGMPEDHVLNVTCGDVNFDNMSVRYYDDEIPLYREAFSVFRVCATTDYFNHGTPGNPGYRQVSRVPGNELMRGVRTMPDVSAMKVKLAKRASDKFGKDGMRISFERARLSGIFYRMYENERIGVPVDFSGVVADESQDKVYKNGTGSRGAVINRKIKAYEEDYARWKAAFSG